MYSVVVLNDREMRAIGEALQAEADRQGEDLTGIFMKMGAFHYLPDGELVELCRKLERALPTP